MDAEESNEISSEILTGYSKPILVEIPIWELHTWVSAFRKKLGHVVEEERTAGIQASLASSSY